jgi:hypothetical protein
VDQPDGGVAGRRRAALVSAAVIAVIIVAVVVADHLAVGAGDGDEPVATGRPAQAAPYTGSLPELPPSEAERRIVTDPDELEDIIGEQARAQAPLVAVADEIQRVVEEHGLDGFGGIAIDDEAGAVTLYWKGELPDELDSVIAASAVTVDVHPADYTEAELLAEAERIARLGTTRSGAVILQVGPLDDYSGLMVVVDSADAARRGDQEIDSPVNLEFSTGERAVALGG